MSRYWVNHDYEIVWTTSNNITPEDYDDSQIEQINYKKFMKLLKEGFEISDPDTYGIEE